MTRPKKISADAIRIRIHVLDRDGQHVRFAMYINGAITGPFIVIRADEMDPFIQRIKPTIYEDLK